jgi:4'-phosphopantetheinyl transferase
VPLTSGEIHLWLASLDQKASLLGGFLQTLSPEERRQADRFRRDRDRTRFVTGHGVLRSILGSYLNTGPGQLQLCRGENGKPRLLDSSGGDEIHFNLSHSDGAALFAFALDREVGVDIECVREVPEMDQIAEQCFSAKENELLRSLPRGQKKDFFFSVWTCREAFLKALGHGLLRPLQRVDLLPVPGERFTSVDMDGESGGASRWTVEPLAPAPGLAAALCVQGESASAHFFNWSMETVRI